MICVGFYMILHVLFYPGGLRAPRPVQLIGLRPPRTDGRTDGLTDGRSDDRTVGRLDEGAIGLSDGLLAMVDHGPPWLTVVGHD